MIYIPKFPFGNVLQIISSLIICGHLIAMDRLNPWCHMIKLENPHNQRFYYMEIRKDIFDDTVISITRGGRNSSVHRLVYCRDPLSCKMELDRLLRLRQGRGYVRVE
jgi:hypothetical protein